MHVAQAQAVSHAIVYPQSQGQRAGVAVSTSSSLYPSLNEYMGMTITPEMINQQMALLPAAPSQVTHRFVMFNYFSRNRNCCNSATLKVVACFNVVLLSYKSGTVPYLSRT